MERPYKIIRRIVYSAALSALLLWSVSCTVFRAEQKLGSVYFYLGEYFNNDGISSDENRKDGNYDTPENPSGSSYPAEELPPGNAVVPVMECPGLLIMFPPTQDGMLNNIECEGQILKGFTPQRFNALYFAGSGTLGDQEGVFKFRFRDGAVIRQTLVFKDWCSEKDDIEDNVIYSCSHRHNYDGKDEQIQCRLFAVKVDLNRERYLTSIQLPENRDIHIFALTAMVPIE